MKSRVLSQQGRELFTSGMTLTSDQLSPRSERKLRPNINSFGALGDVESDEDEELSTVEMEEVEYRDPDAPKVKSPRLMMTSPHGSDSGRLTSPRWEVVTAVRRPPKLSLDGGATTTTTIPVAEERTMMSLASPHDEGDMSTLTALTTDTKGRRDNRRSHHGSKANRFKALKQRLDSIAKRDQQREAAKMNKRSNSEYVDEEDSTWAVDEDEDAW